MISEQDQEAAVRRCLAKVAAVKEDIASHTSSDTPASDWKDALVRANNHLELADKVLRAAFDAKSS